MIKNTNPQIHEAYEVAKEVYSKNTSISEGKKHLSGLGLNEASSHFYIQAYSGMMQGKAYSRSINAYAAEYFLGQIHMEKGENGLKIALQALSQHIEYYEEVRGVKLKKVKKVFFDFSGLLETVENELVFPDEVDSDQGYLEGKTKQVLVNGYERNPEARKVCIDHYGLNCQICDFNFAEKYGELGKDFIHVHYLIEISTIKKEYSIKPKNDLIPVCPNCHAMLHKKIPAYTIEELKTILIHNNVSS